MPRRFRPTWPSPRSRPHMVYVFLSRPALHLSCLPHPCLPPIPAFSLGPPVFRSDDLCTPPKIYLLPRISVRRNAQPRSRRRAISRAPNSRGPSSSVSQSCETGAQRGNCMAIPKQDGIVYNQSTRRSSSKTRASSFASVLPLAHPTPRPRLSPRCTSVSFLPTTSRCPLLIRDQDPQPVVTGVVARTSLHRQT
jgi:hypothetical protein